MSDRSAHDRPPQVPQAAAFANVDVATHLSARSRAARNFSSTSDSSSSYAANSYAPPSSYATNSYATSSFAANSYATNSYSPQSSCDEFARIDAPPTAARVKMLWTEAKGEGGGSTSSAKKAPPPPALPQPLSIQKRAPPVVTPPVPPHPALLPPMALKAPATQPLPTDPLQQRIAKWEALLSAGAIGGGDAGSPVIAPPRHALKRGVADMSEVFAVYRSTCAEILREDPQSASKMSIDKRLWTSWYKEISSLRAAQPHPPPPPSKKAADKLQKVLAASAAFYARLVDDLAAVLERGASDGARQEATRSSLHMSLVALGDIARYAQKASPTPSEPDWSAAERQYEDALRVLPSSGKAYNQLAFLAISQRQVLRAVYLFVRSLACATPFSSQRNLAQALAKGNVRDQDALVRSNAVTEVQDRLETLALSALVVLFKKKKPATLELPFQARANTLLGGLEYYLATRTSMLFAGAQVDLASMQAALSQVVCVVVFLVHDFQVPTGSNPDRPIPRVSFDDETASWRHVANVRRLLMLGFSLVTSMMKECKKAVVSPAYMVIAKDLLNTLLPPISIFLRWLQLHPWFLHAAEGTSAAAAARHFVRSTAKFLRSVSTSLLADRILDEDLAQMSAKRLPEDVELAGFLPLESTSASRHEAQFRPHEGVPTLDADLLLDIRMCRALSFSDEFAQLSERLAETTMTEDADAVAAERTLDVQESDSSTGSSREPSSDLVEEDDAEGDDDDDNNGEGDAACVAEAEEAATQAAAQQAAVASAPAGGKARRRAPPASKPRSVPRASGATEDHLEAAEESLAFAAVMSIGANRSLYDASSVSGTPSPAAPKCLIVIDVPNVAMRHGLGKKFSCAGVRIAYAYYRERGHRVVGFLPDYLLDESEVETRRRVARAGTEVSAAKLPDDVALLQTMVDEGVLIPTPPQDYDDSYCIQYAGMYDGCVLTNDMYRDHVEGMTGPRERKVAMRMWLVAHLISFTWVRNDLLPNPDFRYPKPARL